VIVRNYLGWGCHIGSDKIGECSGEGGEKIGDIQAPPKTFHKNAYAAKPNPLRNKLYTTPDSSIFPLPTNDFQKLIKFKSDLGNEFVGKKGEKPSEEKQIEKLCEQPQPKPKPKPIWFHCDHRVRDGQKDEFFINRKREGEWLRSGQPRTGTNHLMLFLSLVCHYLGVKPLFT
jgi:hypothetical protein